MASLVNRTSYSAPNVNVETSGPGGGGLGDIDPFFLAMAKRRATLEAEQAAMRNRSMRFDLQKKLQDKSFDDRTPDWGAEEEKIRDRIYKKQLQDADINPPKKLVTGFNIIPGVVEDTSMLPVSMRPKQANLAPAETNTAGIDDPHHLGTGGYDPVEAEARSRADLSSPGGHGTGDDFERGMLQMTAEEAARKRLLKAQGQQQYFSGRG